MAKINFKMGDSVVVRPNVTDPDLHINIGGWQGRISEINEEDHLICIDWDSLTLKQIPGETIDQSEEEGLDWTKMYLHPEEVERTTPRDSEDEVEEAIEFLENKHSWSFLGEEGKRIQAVLAKAEAGDDLAAFEAWEEHFRQVLRFPFEAEVSEWQERGPLRTGDKVSVLGIESSEDLYGILVSLRRGRSKYVFPLCDLEVIDKSSSNYQPVKDYAVWFANR
jgi:hypothetical protein